MDRRIFNEIIKQYNLTPIQVKNNPQIIELVNKICEDFKRRKEIKKSLGSVSKHAKHYLTKIITQLNSKNVKLFEYSSELYSSINKLIFVIVDKYKSKIELNKLKWDHENFYAVPSANAWYYEYKLYIRKPLILSSHSKVDPLNEWTDLISINNRTSFKRQKSKLDYRVKIDPNSIIEEYFLSDLESDPSKMTNIIMKNYKGQIIIKYIISIAELIISNLIKYESSVIPEMINTLYDSDAISYIKAYLYKHIDMFEDINDDVISQILSNKYNTYSNLTTYAINNILVELLANVDRILTTNNSSSNLRVLIQNTLSKYKGYKYFLFVALIYYRLYNYEYASCYIILAQMLKIENELNCSKNANIYLNYNFHKLTLRDIWNTICQLYAESDQNYPKKIDYDTNYAFFRCNNYVYHVIVPISDKFSVPISVSRSNSMYGGHASKHVNQDVNNDVDDIVNMLMESQTANENLKLSKTELDDSIDISKTFNIGDSMELNASKIGDSINEIENSVNEVESINEIKPNLRKHEITLEDGLRLLGISKSISSTSDFDHNDPTLETQNISEINNKLPSSVKLTDLKNELLATFMKIKNDFDHYNVNLLFDISVIGLTSVMINKSLRWMIETFGAEYNFDIYYNNEKYKELHEQGNNILISYNHSYDYKNELYDRFREYGNNYKSLTFYITDKMTYIYDQNDDYLDDADYRIAYKSFATPRDIYDSFTDVNNNNNSNYEFDYVDDDDNLKKYYDFAYMLVIKNQNQNVDKRYYRKLNYGIDSVMENMCKNDDFNEYDIPVMNRFIGGLENSETNVREIENEIENSENNWIKYVLIGLIIMLVIIVIIRIVMIFKKYISNKDNE